MAAVRFSPLALAALLVALAPHASAQGTWPDDPWTDFRSLTIPGEFNNAGRSVAILGALLCATYNDPETDIGAIALFGRGERGYELISTVQDPSADPTPGFGYPMLSAADRLFVADAGFYFQDHAGPTFVPIAPNRPARVEVFRQLGDQSLSHVQTLENPTGEQPSGFGFAMAHGEYLVVGAPFADVFGIQDVGAVFVYLRRYQQLEYVRVATLLPPIPSPRGYFGYSVANADDAIIVGWPGYDDGRAVMYEEFGVGDWKLDRVLAPTDLTLPEGLRLGSFGAAVSASSSLDDLIAISATSCSALGRTSFGSVVVLTRDGFDGEKYTQTALIQQPQSFGGADFGRFVHVAAGVPANYLVVGSGARTHGGGIINVYSNQYSETT